MKKACCLIKENGYPSKMLLCSMRISPTTGGEKHCWHLEKLAGAGIVYTCPPKFIGELLLEGNHIEFRDQIHEPIPDGVMEKLMKIPYFAKGYDEKGYKWEDFTFHPAVQTTAKQFRQAVQGMIDFIKESIS